MVRSIEELHNAGQAVLHRIQELIGTGDIRLIYLTRSADIDPAYLTEVAEIKRFLERWSADDQFRALVETDPRAAARSLGLDHIDPVNLRSLWDADAAGDELTNLPILRYRSFILEKLTHRNRIRNGAASMDPRYAAWRQRQMRRAELELNQFVSNSIVHAPFCIELCQGCSVGCWFCGISAPKLDDILYYTPENAALFSSMVETLQGLFGEQAGYGFCYWATDPIDNPDYEKFMVDFHRITGTFPQTTTALPLKDLDRTRRLLELSQQKGGMLDRFSVLSLKQLMRIHEEFTPEQLLYVELVTQNKESHQAKSRAGRAMARAERRPDNGATPIGNQVADGTIACVSGFLINAVRRTVQLISPCQASQRFPLGYIVYDEATYADADEFRQIVHRMFDKHMRITVRGDQPLQFHDFLQFRHLDNGVEVRSQHTRKEFADNPLLSELGRLVLRGSLTADEIVDELAVRYGVYRAEALHALNVFFEHGVLAEHAARQPIEAVAAATPIEATATM